MTTWTSCPIDNTTHQYPTSAPRVIAFSEKREYRCYGVQLGSRLFMTARHCLRGPMQVAVGDEGQLRVLDANVHATKDLALLTTEQKNGVYPRVSLGQPPKFARAYFACKRQTADVVCSRSSCVSQSVELLPGDSGCPVYSATNGTLWGLGVSQRLEGAQIALLSPGDLVT